MVNNQKWADFTFVDKTVRANKQCETSQREYTSFACPYKCGRAIQMPSANVSKSKSTECRNHLLLCDGVAEDGRRAKDDPRLLSTPAFKKRALEGEASGPVADTTVLTERCETLEREKTALQSQVYDLTSMANALAENKRQADARFAQLQAQMTASNQRVRNLEIRGARQEMDLCVIANKLGFDQAPPVPSIQLLVQSIDTLKAPPRTMATPSRTHFPLNESDALNPRVAELQDELRKSKKRVSKLSAALANKDEQAATDRRRVAEQAEKDRKLLAKVRRDMQLKCHPDKHMQYRDTEHMATELSKAVNELFA